MLNPIKSISLVITTLMVGSVLPTSLLATQVNRAQNAAAQKDDVEINPIGSDDLDLGSLVDWLAAKQDIQIMNATTLSANNKIKFYGKTTVDADKMFELVQAILRSNDRALVKSHTDGFYEIVELNKVRPYAPQGDPTKFKNAEYVTAVINLNSISPYLALEHLKQFMYVGGKAPISTNSVGALPNSKTLIITDTAKRLRIIAQLIKDIDKPIEKPDPLFYSVKYLDPTELKSQLEEVLELASPTTDETKVNALSGGPTNRNLRIVANERLRQLILIGTVEQQSAAISLVNRLDVGLGLKLERYQFNHVAASRVDEFVRQSLVGMNEKTRDRMYQATIEEQANQLIVTSTVEIHKQIVDLQKEIDKPTEDGKEIISPVVFYPLKNVEALDILDTLQSLVGRLSQDQERLGRRRSSRSPNVSTRGGFEVPGPNTYNPGFEGQQSPRPPVFNDDPNDPEFPSTAQLNGQIPFGRNTLGRTPFGGIQQGGLTSLFLDDTRRPENIIPGDAQITVDESSNTLIVVAAPSVQRLYKEIIAKLDVRPPSVRIEVTVVTISGNDDLSLGVEISGGDRTGGQKQLFAFTSFGFSQVDPLNAALRITEPGIGFHGTLIDPDVADVVLRATSSHSRAKVSSLGSILVKDHSEGTLSSVAEVAFESVNASNTVSTTSFAGFAEAGTTIAVTPQISHDDYLNLDFDVTVNDFGAREEGAILPPRTTDRVESEVSIPDGHTVVIGGLKRHSNGASSRGLPILDRIPILSLLTSAKSESNDDQRLYIFLKATILRDDKFKDLRYLSEIDIRDADIPTDLPQSSPIVVR